MRAARFKALFKTLHRDQVGQATSDTEEIIQRDFYRQVERCLDQGAGTCHLRRPDIASLMAGALRFFHGQRYLLREWVVMPNHVHVLFWPAPNRLVGEIVKSWKQFVSMRAKRILGLPEGRFWQPESFDHWVRNNQEHEHIAKYIRHNPVVAGLCAQPESWRWSSAWADKTASPKTLS